MGYPLVGSSHWPPQVRMVAVCMPPSIFQTDVSLFGVQSVSLIQNERSLLGEMQSAKNELASHVWAKTRDVVLQILWPLTLVLSSMPVRMSSVSRDDNSLANDAGSRFAQSLNHQFGGGLQLYFKLEIFPELDSL